MLKFGQVTRGSEVAELIVWLPSMLIRLFRLVAVILRPPRWQLSCQRDLAGDLDRFGSCPAPVNAVVVAAVPGACERPDGPASPTAAYRAACTCSTAPARRS